MNLELVKETKDQPINRKRNISNTKHVNIAQRQAAEGNRGRIKNIRREGFREEEGRILPSVDTGGNVPVVGGGGEGGGVRFGKKGGRGGGQVG
ncbi:hypothetical protein PoB_007066700 [Plakobranchus ocellatus]|uniref:Uncharacterized protein n=1 Tax=Plakobranchus ocellatus TaxID=259542 RepID=A0AAV4DIS5_9GAST|nr:hypothetical protein PoB_007066700 [Plakobranchus ocellatus]